MRKADSGYTLIEVIVMVGVLSLILLAIYAFLSNLLGFSRKFTSAMSTQQQINTVLKEFVREARTMSISEGGAYPIQEASSTSFTFFSDYDKDGTVERIRYFYSTTTTSIMKGIIEPVGGVYNSANESISQRISNVTTAATTTAVFTYFNSSYDGVGTTTALATPVNIPSIRHIKVQFFVMLKGFNQQSTSTTIFSTQVTPRNLKDNL